MGEDAGNKHPHVILAFKLVVHAGEQLALYIKKLNMCKLFNTATSF